VDPERHRHECERSFGILRHHRRRADRRRLVGRRPFDLGDRRQRRAIEVKSWTAANGRIELFLPMGYAIAAGDTFSVYPGCDKRLETCLGRFGNVVNFRGEPYVPGIDAMMSYPDAR
jgi:uncharacterized phage protein (TIGR02218 family)